MRWAPATIILILLLTAVGALPSMGANIAGDETILPLPMEFYNVSGGTNYGGAYMAPNGFVGYSDAATPTPLFNQQQDTYTSGWRTNRVTAEIYALFPHAVKLMQIRFYPLGDDQTLDQMTGFGLYYGVGEMAFQITSSPSLDSIQTINDSVTIDFGEGIIVNALTFIFWVVSAEDRETYGSELEFYVDGRYRSPYTPPQTIINQTNITYQNLTYTNTTYLTQPTTITFPTYQNITQTFQNDTYLSAPNITYQNITQTSPNVTYANYSYTNLTNETYVTATEGVQTIYYENTTERIINLTQPRAASGRDDTTQITQQVIQAEPSDTFPIWAGAIMLLLVVIIALQVMLMRKKPPPPPLVKTTPIPLPKPKAYPMLPFKVVAPKLPPPPSAPSEAVESIKEHMDAIGVLEKTLKRADPRVKRLPAPLVETE